MKFYEEKNAFKEINHKNDNNCINFKNKINHSKKEINSKEENNYDKSFLVYINNFLDLLRTSKIIKKKDIEKLNIKFPLCFLIILIFIKYFISKKLTTLYLCILMILPFCSFILINIIIKEKYFGDVALFDKMNLLIKDFLKLFIISIFPLSFFTYLTSIINYSSIVGKVGNILSIIYSAFIAQKLFLDYIKIIYNNDNIDIITKDERYKIFFIYLIIYSLISYIINI
jgi:hypothetical protein